MVDANIVELNLTPALAKKHVRDIAQDSGRIFFCDHAEKRMKQRRITRIQVIRCIQKGYITEGPARSLKNGNWELTMEIFSAGEALTSVIALDRDDDGNYIIVITAYS